MTPLDQLLDALPPWVLVGGKGGVGKTTCASALALRAAGRGERTLLLSTDPAGALGDALGRVVDAPLSGAPRECAGRPGLFAAQLDARVERDAFLARWRDVLVGILDRGTYLDRAELDGLVDASLPGLDETMALLALLDLEGAGWARVVLDTAPTGHALRLLQLPATFAALVALLDAMQDKHRFMVRALTHRYRDDEADRFLEAMRSRVAALRRVLADPSRFGVVLVVRPEALVVEETARYVAALGSLAIPLRAIVINAIPDPADSSAAAALDALAGVSPGVPRYEVPVLRGEAWDAEGWGAAVTPGRMVRGAGRGARDAHEQGVSAAGSVEADPAARSTVAHPAPRAPRPESLAPHAPHPASRAVLELTIVGGKGGVGKTTVACALGVITASTERPVLVVSTDPAPSVADALDQRVGEAVVPVDGAPGMFAQQLDASAAFARFRERWERRVDELFDALVRGGMDAAHDRRITRDLLALAPPGIDELYALATLGETAASGRYAAIIVDPAPTGHLLRLLELPAIALEWSHRLMRIMLAHQALVGLGDAARELLAFARRTRALGEMLRDPGRAAVLVVALDEPLVRSETARLLARVRGLGVSVPALIWNRTSHPPAPLPTGGAIEQFEAAEVTPPPRGVSALRRWASAWGSFPRIAHE
ncbi:MAG TPA: ArsA family ATPase [Gemmatimonadaceae bacterium]